MLYFYYFVMSMWTWISIERESCWRWRLRISSSQCHNNQVFVPPRKPPKSVKDLYDSHTYDLKTRVDIWTRMDIMSLQYEILGQTFHLTMWFFQFIHGITFKWDYVIWFSIVLLVWIGLWKKIDNLLSSSRPSQMVLSKFGYLWQVFMLNWILWTKNYFKVYHRKQVKSPSNMKFVTSLMNLNVNHVGYLKVCHTIKKMKSLILLSLQLL